MWQEGWEALWPRLYDPLPMKMVGIKDTFGCSGHNYQEVLAYHGLTKEAVAEAVREMAG